MTTNQKILKAIQIIVLFAVIIGAVSLFYNSIELFGYYSVSDKTFKAMQKPQAIIGLIASLVAIASAVAGVVALFSDKPVAKKVAFSLAIVAVVAFVAFIVASNQVWLKWFKDFTEYNGGRPYDISGTTRAQMYAVYSGVLGALIPQLVYFVMLTATCVASMIIKKKAAQPEQTQENN